MELAPPRGMRDFYPEEWRAREALFNVWREVAALYGFQGYDAPVVETEELLTRKAGEEITQQIYTFTDKSDRRLALRPEMTPSLARMVIAKQNALQFPIKWYSIPQCFRYERMTRGRKREHYQWNLDIIGEASVMAEVEVIGAAVESLRRLGLKSDQVKIRIGSRALLSELLEHSGFPVERHMAVYLALDKRGKIDDEEIKKLLEAEGFTGDLVEKVFDLLGLKQLDEVAARLGEASPAVARVRELFTMARELGFDDFLTFDIGVVRGLGYYTGIVFEAFSLVGSFRAIFGGGRYDSLLTSLGGDPCPCVGMGFGDVVIQELLSDLGIPLGGDTGLDVCVGFMTEDCRVAAARIAAQFRRENRKTDLALGPEKAKKFFSRVDRLGATNAVFIGPDEVASGRFKMKNMKTREESPLVVGA